MRTLFCLLVFCGPLRAESPFEANPESRINEVQVIGTHNSYHIAPYEKVARVIQSFNKNAEAFDYTHRPLTEQFEELGIRQIELDVFADTKGGLYAAPLGQKLAQGIETHDPDGVLKKPGMKVLHVQDIDFRSTVLTLKQALQETADWSRAHPQHFPILILLELQDTSHSPITVKPERFGLDQLTALETEILSVFKKDEILKPDDVRGEFASLPEALSKCGWPTVKEASGKVMFAMDNESPLRDLYLKGHDALQERLLFVSVPTHHPAAAFVKLNDPLGGFERIQELVKKGFIIRTRADSDTYEARKNDTSRRDRALASGAQFISTDYPEPDRRLSDYHVTFGKGAVTRPNPLVP